MHVAESRSRSRNTLLTGTPLLFLTGTRGGRREWRMMLLSSGHAYVRTWLPLPRLVSGTIQAWRHASQRRRSPGSGCSRQARSRPRPRPVRGSVSVRTNRNIGSGAVKCGASVVALPFSSRQG
jgi:hypothetical protein